MDIRSKVLTALRWTAAARFLGQLFSWTITIVVIRLLSPSDYGLMAMAIAITSFLYLVNSLGLDAVLVQKRDLDEVTRRQVFSIVIVINALFFAALIFSAPLIGKFLNEPRLVPITRVLAIQFIVFIFETLPEAQLEREIEFKKMSLVDLGTMIIGSLTALTLAWAGMEVWALVWGQLATQASRVIGLNIISPCLCWPSLSVRGIRDTIVFGGYATIDRVLWFIFSEADKFIGGKLLGKELLGFYAVANHLASLPINKLAGLVNSVAFPAFSRVQSEPEKVNAYLLKALRVMSILVFPVFLGISSVAPELVTLFLGEKWQRAALPLQILSIVMPIRMLGTLLPPLLWGVGRPDVSATNFLIAAAVMPVAFYIGTNWGPTGLAFAWLLVYPAVFLIFVLRASQVVKLPLADFLSAMARPAIASIGMYGAIMATKVYAFGQIGDVAYLLQLVLVGALVYTALVSSLHRERVREALDLLKR